MREAIDYNALSWVRQELGATLKAARQHLEEYASNKDKQSLQGCVARLHEARGPLKMVNLKGADLLTGEMEEVIADLLLDSIDQTETALELLMQGFLELPEYLYSLRSGRSDNPAVLFPLINSLRANRGEQPLEEDAVFSPDLSAHVPARVFDIRADHGEQNVATVARAARLRFQGGLLDWYRNGDGAAGLQTLIDVLDHLQQQAGSEPVARLWWVSAGVAELLRDGELQVTADIKRLFGQIDRHIKRLMDKGEDVFADVLTDDLLKNLLFRINTVSSGSARVADIRATYGLDSQSGEASSADVNSVSLAACSEELLQTVSSTVSEDIVRIKEQLDEFLKNNQSDNGVLSTVADELHALSNMLGMIGMAGLGEVIAGKEQLLRMCASGSQKLGEEDLVEMANTLVATEDALADITATAGSQASAGDGDDVTFRQGREAVISAVIADMSSAKEAINEFLRSCGDFDLLVDVPVILNRIHGSLQLVGQERVATATSMIRTFISRELVAAHRELSDEDLDTLADAICSIEYCVEELAENRDYGQRAMDIAEESLAKLGYACPSAEYAEGVEADLQESAVVTADNTSGVANDEQAAPTGGSNDVTAMQVIGEDADPEIVEIFIEEAAEELEKITGLIPEWCDDSANQDLLTEIRRSFHTLKGSGRMVGAMATGEFSWAVEDLINNLLEGTVDVSEQVVNLLLQVPSALSGLLEQVKDPVAVPSSDINNIARQAHAIGKPVALPPVDISQISDEPVVRVDTGESVAAPAVEQTPIVIAEDFPVLAETADPEIVEIFLEEATEEFDKISVSIPVWVTRPGDPEILTELQRSFHTLKGSGRMAGAMRIGEFSWIIESLFNKLIDGVIQQSASLFAFMGRVPDVLSQLLAQVRDGSEPGMDIQEIMVQASTLVNGGQLAVPVDDVDAVTDIEEDGYVDGSDEEYSCAEADEPSLSDIFSNECHEHLQVLDTWLENYTEPGQVTDELYRALHTLSGISESAEMPTIGRLADGLYAWISVLYEEHQAVNAEGYGVLQDCTAEIARMLEALPEELSDEQALTSLCERVAALSVHGSTPEPAEDIAVVDGEEEFIETVVVETVNDASMPVTVEPAVDESVEREAVEQEPMAEEPAVTESAEILSAELSQPEEVTVDEESVEAPIGDTAAAPVPQDPYADMDQELYEIFVEEATEIMDASEPVLRDWADAPERLDLMAEFQRHLHTLKGGARMVDLVAMGDLSHAVESLVTGMSEGRIPSSPDVFGMLAEAHDRLAEMLEQVRNRRPTESAADLEARFNVVINGGAVPKPESEAGPETEIEAETDLAAEPVDVMRDETGGQAGDDEHANDQVEMEVDSSVIGAVDDQEPDSPTEVSDRPDEAVSTAGKEGSDGRPVTAVNKISPPRLVIEQDMQENAHGEQVKVQADLLDNMINYAGEISIYRSRMEQQISDYRFNLSELSQTISRLRDQLRQLEMETEAQILHRYEQESEQRNQEFDPLEMDRYSALQQSSRSLIESISDLHSLQEIMENTTRDSETLLLQQSRVSTELQESLIRTRMVPFVSLSPRLRRIARQSARQLDKKVDVSLVGEDGEMDRAVVERIIAPLEHMLRNSVAHGIELPRDRKVAGKPVTGRISIEFERDGSEIVLRISDDGAGMNVEAIRARAVERGLVAADSDMPDQDIIQFVLQSGFSTSREVTQLSGRGVGMDVVNSEVKQLGGSLHIESETGKGATLTVRLPYTLAINQGMLVTAGDETFCVPLASVEGVVRFYPEEIRECYGDGQQLFEYGGNEYRLKHLGSLLGTGNMSLPGEHEQVPVLLVRAGDKRIGFHIDSLQGIREVVIKPVGPQLSLVDGISGATILGDGRVVMILDMVAVSLREASVQTASVSSPATRVDDSLLVMVVDDSITVRKVTTRLLERNGYKVVTAKDGVDAMGILQENVPDIMLLDIEMPRMDGFELATHMRNDDSLKHVPIIMITSRTGEKHRERARQIGVQSYLGKPYQESDLLDSIHGIIGITPVAVEG